MAWVYLFFAGLLEVVWAIGLKFTDGFTRPWPVAITVGAMLLDLYLLSMALRIIPVGTGYAVWTGIGAVGTAILGMVFLGETRDLSRLLSIGLIVLGILGLRLTSPS